jgi:hypothetical protein
MSLWLAMIPSHHSRTGNSHDYPDRNHRVHQCLDRPAQNFNGDRREGNTRPEYALAQ